jgi:ribosomal protein S18 acetylase RimI-like enzyme
LDTIFGAWEDAFAGYARTWSRQEFERDMRRRGYVASLSFGAFDDDKLVSFTLNGIGQFNGTRTAYDTGTGTIQDYRGLGLATRIFDRSVPYLRQAGIEQYLLEVLQTNSAAISIYTKSGFAIRRELNYFIQDVDDLFAVHRSFPADCLISDTDLIGIQAMTDAWDYEPSWQNSLDAIGRAPDHFVIKGAFVENEMVGYVVIEPGSGDITQLSVRRDYRRLGIGSGMLHALLRCNVANRVKVVNTDHRCAAIIPFLESNGIRRTGAQFEMIKRLD